MYICLVRTGTGYTLLLRCPKCAVSLSFGTFRPRRPTLLAVSATGGARRLGSSRTRQKVTQAIRISRKGIAFGAFRSFFLIGVSQSAEKKNKNPTKSAPFPKQTRIACVTLSSLVPTILGWKRPGTIGRRQHKRFILVTDLPTGESGHSRR